jgi:hypothetical protein
MEAQMNHYLGTIKPVQGERICLDHEDDGVSLEDLKVCVSYVLQLRPDLQITIYSGHLIKEQLGSEHDDYLAKNTSLWIAQYTSGSPTWPKGTWPSYTLWQYTDKGRVPGIEGNCDCNQFNGSRDNCIKWFGPVGSEVAPGPDVRPEDKKVSITINTDEGVAVSILVNGKER